MALTSFLTNIADKLRSYLGGDKITARSFADKIDDVFEVGAKSEYDSFWDEYQRPLLNPLTECQQLFSGRGWNDKNFRPKNDIVATGNASSMFLMNAVTDLKGILEDCGVVLDTSQATSTQMLFMSSTWLTALPEINASNSTSIGHMFSYCSNLKTVDKFVFGEKNLTGGSVPSFTGTSPFISCSALEHIIFDGTLACNGIDLHWSTKLDKESLLSLISVLKDYSADTSETKWVCTIGTENLAKLTDGEKAVATQKGWTLA